MRLVRRLGPRAAVELGQHVAHVHVDRPRAEKELSSDLPVRSPDCDEPEDFELAPRQAGPVQVAGSPAAEPAVNVC
jgi:hypothetical protein